MEKEIMFARSLEKVRRIAKEQGNCVSEAQVRAEFDALALNDAQLQMVFDYLAKHRVGIGEPVDPDEYLTEEERDYLQDYLDAVALLPSCSEGERQAFTASAMAGDSQAAGRLTESYLKDVADIAKLYAGQGVPLEDLIGEGNVALAAGIGMLGAMEEMERASEGEKRSLEETCAAAQGILIKRVMEAMEECIRESADSRKAGDRVAEKVNKVADKARELAEELNRKVTPEELMEESGLSLKAIRDAMRMSGYKIDDIKN